MDYSGQNMTTRHMRQNPHGNLDYVLPIQADGNLYTGTEEQVDKLKNVPTLELTVSELERSVCSQPSCDTSWLSDGRIYIYITKGKRVNCMNE